MTAILCATAPGGDTPAVPRAHLQFAGQSILEYQARQARELGIDHVIALVDRADLSLSRMVDRMMGEGVRVQLVRDMPTLMRDMPRDTDIILFLDGAIVGQAQLAALAQLPGCGLLVAEDTAMTSHLERIDGMHRWCGLARISADVVFGTLDLIGDWDLCSTLMRAAVQANAKRITIPQADLVEGRVAVVDRQATADLVAQAVLAKEHRDEGGQVGADHLVMAPLARLASTRLVRMQVTEGQARAGAAAFAALAIGMIYPGWAALAWLLLCAAMVASVAADQLGQMARRRLSRAWVDQAPVALVLVGIVLLAGHYGAWDAALCLAALSGVIHMSARGAQNLHSRRWAYASPGSALLAIGLGMLIGQAPLVTLFAALCAVGSVGWLLAEERG